MDTVVCLRCPLELLVFLVCRLHCYNVIQSVTEGASGLVTLRVPFVLNPEGTIFPFIKNATTIDLDVLKSNISDMQCTWKVQIEKQYMKKETDL